jgi:hypothetical protein
MSAPHPDSGQPPICSAKGCREPAVWALLWNNPKLHTADRRKTWVACDAHRHHLSQFLDLRGFLRSVEPLSTP